VDNYNAMGGMEGYPGQPAAPGHLSSYVTNFTLREAPTGRTNYTDVAAGTTVTWLSKLDIYGNAVKEQLSCCNQQSMTTTDTNGYAMPDSVTKGDPSQGGALTSTFGHDYNTSARKSATDPNSRETA
jgi:hypothetical protein